MNCVENFPATGCGFWGRFVRKVWNATIKQVQIAYFSQFKNDFQYNLVRSINTDKIYYNF